jgi:hypothetical protein
MGFPIPFSEKNRQPNDDVQSSLWRRKAFGEKSLLRSSYKRGCQEKRLLPALRRDAGVVTYIQPSHSRKGDWLAALGRRRLQRRCQPQLLVVPTQRFHDIVVLDTFLIQNLCARLAVRVIATQALMCSRTGQVGFYSKDQKHFVLLLQLTRAWQRPQTANKINEMGRGTARQKAHLWDIHQESPLVLKPCPTAMCLRP